MGALLETGNNTSTRLKYLRTESSEEFAEPKSVRLVQNLDNTSTGNSLSQTSQCCQGRHIGDI
jgi:hypothetical protein